MARLRRLAKRGSVSRLCREDCAIARSPRYYYGVGGFFCGWGVYDV